MPFKPDQAPPMDLSARITHLFNSSAETQLQTLATLTPQISAAAQQLTQCLLNNGKILICGNARSTTAAQHFATLLLNYFELERPGLPAIALTSDAAIITTITDDNSLNDIFAKQIRALGQSVDTLILITCSGRSDNIINAVQAAHDRNMAIVALSGGDGGGMARQLLQQDIEIRVPTQSAARIQEVHILIIHCLCDLIDHQLLGQED